MSRTGAKQARAGLHSWNYSRTGGCGPLVGDIRTNLGATWRETAALKFAIAVQAKAFLTFCQGCPEGAPGRTRAYVESKPTPALCLVAPPPGMTTFTLGASRREWATNGACPPPKAYCLGPPAGDARDRRMSGGTKGIRNIRVSTGSELEMLISECHRK